MTKLYNNKILECSLPFIIYKLEKIKKTSKNDVERLIKYFKSNNYYGEYIEDFSYIMKENEEEELNNFIGITYNDDSFIFMDKNFLISVFDNNSKKLNFYLHMIALKSISNKMDKNEIENLKLGDFFKKHKNVFNDKYDEISYYNDYTFKELNDEPLEEFFTKIQSELSDFIRKKSKKELKIDGFIYVEALDFIIKELIKKHNTQYKSIRHIMKESLYELSPLNKENNSNENEIEFNL